MFRQPKFNGQKLKATSGRGNGTNYVTPGGERVKLSDKCMALVQDRDEALAQDRDDSVKVKENYGFMPMPERSIHWIGRPPNKDDRPTNTNIRTEGPRPANGGKRFK